MTSKAYFACLSSRLLTHKKQSYKKRNLRETKEEHSLTMYKINNIAEPLVGEHIKLMGWDDILIN